MKQVKFILLTFFIFTLFFNSSAQPPSTGNVQVDFHVKWDGKVIPDVSFVSDLVRTTEVIEYRNGASPNTAQRAPGQTEYQPIVLKRPRSMDNEFEKWANKVSYVGSGLGSEVSLRDFRKDIIIELIDNTGRTLMAFMVYKCWPSKYVPLTKLEKNSSDEAMEILVLEHEGWERDLSIR